MHHPSPNQLVLFSSNRWPRALKSGVGVGVCGGEWGRETWKKKCRGEDKGDVVIKNGQRLSVSMDHCAIFFLNVWCWCFYSGHSCQQHRHSCQWGEREGERERDTCIEGEGGVRQREREREREWERDTPLPTSSRRNWTGCQTFARILGKLICERQKLEWRRANRILR